MLNQQFFLGDWQIEPASNTLRLGKTKRTIEPKAMDVLLLLCQQAGEVVSADDIVSQCWPGSPVGDNPIHKTITQLRKALDDKASDPLFIETIRKRGYRIIADVQFLEDEHTRAEETIWQGQSPYPGLTAFTQQESQVYYGRNAAVKNLVNRLAEQCSKKRPFTLIIGPSGSGKSSLVHAGLLPRLLSDKGPNGIHAIDYTSIDFSDIHPARVIDELAACMLDWDINDAPVFEGESADSLALKLANHPEDVINTTKTKISQTAQYNTSAYPCFVIVLDRLEAYLATSEVSTHQRESAFTLLETLSKSSLFIVLLVCRNDFYHQLAAYPTLMKNKERGAHFDLTPPSAGELSQIIRLPAIAAGLEWQQDSTTDTLLDDIIFTDAAAEPNCLPLLQYTLQELYLQRKDNILQVSTYQQLGGIEGAIGHKAEQLFQHMPAKVQATLDRVLPLVITLANDGTTLTSRTALWSELTNDNEKQFAELMVENRLFVSYLHQNKACFKVAHEAVLRSWQRVQTWLQQHQSSLVSKSRLEQQTKQWLQDNKSKAFLLTEGKPLTDALALKADPSLTLSEYELSLIKASQKSAQRKRVIRGVTFAALACLTIVSFGAMLQSQQSQHLAERKRLEAENLMGYMIGDFADKLRSVKRMDLLEGISEQALSYVEQAQQASEYGFFTLSPPKASFELRFQHALSLQAMAEVRFYRDDTETAKQLYEEADKRLSALLEEQPNNFELLKAAGANAFWLGDIELRSYNFVLADEQFNRYLRYSEKMLKLSPSNPDALLELSYATNSIGSVAFRQQDFDKALSFFESSLAYKQKLLEKSVSPIITATAVADTYSWIASIQIHEGRIHEAQLTFAKAETILEKSLSTYSGNAEIIETLSLIKMNAAKSRQFIEDPSVSVEQLNDAKKLLIQILEQDPDNSSWQSYYKHIRALLDYYKSLNSISALHNQSVEQDITVDELLRDGARLSSKIYAVHSYQYRHEWKISRNLLAQLNIEHAIEEVLNNNINAEFINVRLLEEYVLYQIASIRQTLNDAGKNINIVQKECESLFSITNSVVNLSKHPLFLQAHVFAGYCLNKRTAVAKHRRQLALMNVSMPHYFTTINKELINDNTTEL